MGGERNKPLGFLTLGKALGGRRLKKKKFILCFLVLLWLYLMSI